MNRIHPHLGEIDLIAKLADVKLEQYNQTVLLHSLIELFVEKGILNRKELADKAAQLDTLNLDPQHPTL